MRVDAEMDAPVRSRHGWLMRGVALALSWVMPATTVWSAAPLERGTGPITVPLPRLAASPAAEDVEAATPDLAGISNALSRLRGRAAGQTPWTRASVAMGEPGAPMQAPPPPPPAACVASFFGPLRFVRTNGPKNEYVRTVSVPSWIVSPFHLRIQNGEPNGTFRVSSATVHVNGVQVAAQSDFNQNVAALDRLVTLTPTTTLKVVLASKPTSYLTINLCGAGGDHTAPRLTWTAPQAGTTINDATPRLSLSYDDLVGTGEPGASGVDVASLAVTLDGQDRTALFTRRATDASAEIAEALAEGPHRLQATLRDLAGNSVQAVSDFVVDVTAPTIQVAEPPRGAYLATLGPTIRVTFADNLGVDPQTLEVLVDGESRTASFAPAPGGAAATLALSSGHHEVVARIRDRGGNSAVPASTSFNLDTTPPVVTISQPLSASRHGTPSVEAIVQYRDEQALDLATFEARLDGSVVTLGTGPEGAMGPLPTLAEGAHTLTASIKDRAGNVHAAQSQFWVDTTVPAVRVVMPPPGHPVNPAVEPLVVVVAYSDEQGVDPATFRLTIDGQVVACSPSQGTATCSVTAHLPEGRRTIAAEIRDTTGNLGTATSNFIVDRIAPTGSLVAPGAITGTGVPPIEIQYSDVGTGVVVDSVVIRVDGNDRTAWFARSATGASGAPDAPLADGAHTVTVTLADAAGNAATISGSFTVDTTKPTASFTAPAAFANDSTPAVRLAYSDGAGTGVPGVGSVRVFHRRGEDPETEITALFQIGTEEATAAALSALADGTHHLRAEVTDRAGNVVTTATVFVLDTVAPSYTIVSPAADAFLSNRTPSIVVRHADDRSGVDPATLVLRIDGTDLTARLAPGPGPDEATAVLLPGDALAEGRHTIAVAVSDRAGNAATSIPHTFVVDTVAPQVTSLVPAHNGYFAEAQGLVRTTYADADAGAGNGVGHVEVSVDRVDRSAELTVEATEARLATVLGEGEHEVTVTIYDWANNAARATAMFAVDLSPPVVALSAPADGHAGQAPTVEVTGTLTDADPETTVECRAGGTGSPAALSGSGPGRTFTCTVQLAEGDNQVVAVARDRFGREGSSEPRRLVLDRVAPQVAITDPLSGVCTSAETVTVAGTVSDASISADGPPMRVSVAGTDAACDVAGAGSCGFSATVPVGAGPQATLTATAVDPAENTASVSVTICVDRDVPTVAIDTPVPGSYQRGPTLLVGGTVSDPTSPTHVEVAGVGEATPNPALSRRFEMLVPVADGAVGLTATATDAAGNATTSAPVVVNVDSAPPIVTFSAPAAGTVTRANEILVRGQVQDASPVTLTHAGAPVPLTGGEFSLVVPLPAEGEVPLVFLARDAAGNEVTAAVEIVVDRQSPALSIVFPVPGQANVVGALPLVVQGLVEDATETAVTVSAQGVAAVPASRTLNAWQAAFPSLADGPYEFAATATDAAGNTVTKTVKVFLDLAPPLVTIHAPASGTLTNQPTASVTGIVRETGRVSVVVNGVTAAVQRQGTDQWSFSATVNVPEGTHPVVAVATDASGRTGQAQVSLSGDFTAPTVLLTTPGQVSRGKPGEAVAVVMDGDLASITVRWGSAEITCASSPCTLPLTVPEGTTSGTTIVAQASATDLAQNTGSAAPRAVMVVADGVITGQVLSDATGLVLPGASVRMVAAGAELTATSDEDGRYSLPTGEANAMVLVSLDGHTAVQRDLAIASGTGTVPVDARLTPLGPETVVGADEVVVRVPPSPAPPTSRQPAIAVTFAAGAVPAGTPVRLTALSPQGLPGLLPLGWAPVAAFDLRLAAPPTAALPVRTVFAEGSAPAGVLQLVVYDTQAHAWRIAARDVASAAAVDVSVGAAGAYALVAPDEAERGVPDVGALLPGVDMVALPATATSTGSVSPSSIAPTGGTAKGSLQVHSTTPLPSGTVVQAEVHESYTLRETDAAGLNVVASTAKRRQDIVLFRPAGGAAGSAPPLPDASTLSAEIPITPSRTYGRADIVRGEVVLDILAGREGVRGTVGGNAAVDLVAGDARLTVPAGALTEDTAISVEIPVEPSPFLPSLGGLEPVAEVWLDFSGRALGAAAILSVPQGSIQVGDTVLVARIERALTASVPRPVVVALGSLQGDRVVTVPHPALPGIRDGGQYVVYRSGPVGFVRGTVTAGGSPARALIEPVLASVWPFVATSGGDGAFTLTVPPGPAQVRASVPNTPYAGSAAVMVTEGEITAVALALAGTATTLSITPPHGAIAVPVNIPFQVQSSTQLRPDTVTSAAIRLFKGADAQGEAVPVRVLLAQDRRTISVVPEAPPLPPDAPPDAPGVPALAFETTYTLQVAGLVDAFGGPVAAATSTFVTKDDAPTPIDLKKLVLSVPDASGLVSITAPAGTLIPGSTILIINSGNGFVLTLTAGNDGEVNGVLEASVSDRLLVTITDPNGHATSFEKSQFFDAATGATVVGTGGGVIEGPNGEELRIPEGALDKPVKLRVSAATEAEYAAAFDGDERRPTLTTTHEGQTVVGHFGKALKIEASEETSFNKEVDLAFPLPDFSALPADQRPPKPEDAFYQIYRRIEGPCRDGASECAVAEREVFYQAIDNAYVEGEGANRKVVTASYPWTGYKDGWTRWDPIAGAGFESLGGAVGGGAIGNVAASWAIMMWTYTALLPGAPVNGVITGKVLQPVFKPGATDPVYEGVPGVKVQRDDQQDPSAISAFTNGGGVFTFHDPHFRGGTVEIRADYQGQTYRATAFAVERADTKIRSDPQLQPLLHSLFVNIATANITLPPTAAPPPAPEFGIHILKEEDDRRVEVSSVIAGTPLVIGFSTAGAGGTATVTSATVNGQALNVTRDSSPLPGPSLTYRVQDSSRSDGKFVPTQPGSYTVTATALPPFGPALTEQKVFRVLAAGGTATRALPGAPGVIFVAPKRNGRGISVTVFPVVTFSEPVTNVAGNVSLVDSTGQAAPLKLAGVGVSAQGEEVALETITASSRVTSLTIEPLGSLKYGETYTLRLTDAIEDLDKGPDGQPAPTRLVPFTSTFETFAPEALGQSDQTEMVGLAVIDDRAYTVETQYTGGTGATYQNGLLHVYKLEDPQAPERIGQGTFISYPPRDVAALKRESTDAFGNTTVEKLVAVAASPRTFYQLQGELVYYHEIVSTPSNVFIFNVDGDTPREVGAVSLTQNILDGYPWRITMDGNSLFAATARKGIQVVSLDSATSGYEAEIADGAGRVKSRRELFSGGYRMHAVVQTIPMLPVEGVSSAALLNLFDLKVGHVQLDGTAARLVFATGSSPAVALVMVNPDTTERVYQGKLQNAGGNLTWGNAIAYAQVAGRDLVLVGGIATVDGGSTNAVAVVDVSNPRAFQILGWVKVGHTVGDIIIKDTTAVVSGDRGSVGPDGPGIATFINLSNPVQPFVSGTMSGVASRMALAPNNILLSTERDFLKGNPTALNGVHTATLGNIALVEGTAPGRVVIGDGPRAAENFKLKLRVIPKSYEIASAKVEFRVGQQVIGAPQPVTMSDGRGELPYALGFTYPKAGQQLALPVLVINEGTPEELISAPRPWNTEQPRVAFVWGDKEVEPGLEPKDEAVTPDLPEIDVRLASDEWFRRSTDPAEAPADPWQVNWETQSAPAATRAGVSLSRDGVFETVLDTGTQAGAQRTVTAKVGPVVLGKTDPLTIEVGLPDEGQSRLEVEGPSAVPADDKSTVMLKLTAKDRAGNVIPDGTAVVWEKAEDTDGALVEPQEFTQGGVARVRYRAGIAPGAKTIRAHVEDAILEVQVVQAPLGLLLTAPAHKFYHDRSPVEISVQVTSAAGPVSPEAEVGWFVTIGRMEQTQALAAGQAKARWRFGGLSNRPRVTFIATVGQARAEQVLLWERVPLFGDLRGPEGVRTAAGESEEPTPGGGLLLQVAASPNRAVSVEPLMMAGDLTTDSRVPIERADGTVEQILVKATGTYKVTGLVPGERVSASLGSNRAPNVPPVAHYTGEALSEGSVPDATGVHDATVTSGVTVTEPGYQGQAFRFDGNGVMTVPHHAELAFTDGFMVQVAVKPPPGSRAQVLVEKAADYRLSLEQVSGELRARFAVQTAAGQQFVTSVLPVPADEWSVVTGKFISGRIWIGIDNEAGRSDDFTFLSSAPVHSTAEVQIGPGFTGDLDEVRLFDLTKQPLATFAGGQTSISFVADATGTYEAPIVSTGQLAGGRVLAYYQNLANEGLLLAQEEPPPTALQADLGSFLVEVETFWQDTGERATTWYGFATAKLLGSMVKFARGLLVGSEPGELDLAVLAGDLTGSLFLAPAAIVRDFANSSERLANSQGNGDDALNTAMGALYIAGALLKGKAGVLLRLPKLIKLLKPGSRAGRMMARLVAAETRLAAGAAGVSKVAKLVEIAQAASGAAQLLAPILDACGVHVEALEAFNNMMSNTPDSEQAGVLRKLAPSAEEGITAEDTRDMLFAGGTPLPDGVPAQGGPAPRRFVQMTEKLLDGVRIGKKILSKEGAPVRLQKAAKRLATRVRRYADVDEVKFDDIWKQVKALENVPELQRIVRQLGRKRDLLRIGGRRVLDVAAKVADPKTAAATLSKLGMGSPGVVEVFEFAAQIRWLPKISGRVRVRFYDMIVAVGDKKYFCEVKRWKGFPPNPEALQSALDQMKRDVVLALGTPAGGTGPTLKTLRWILPEALKGKQADIVKRFSAALDDPVVLKALMAAAKDNPALSGGKTGAALRKHLQDTVLKNAKDELNSIITFLK